MVTETSRVRYGGRFQTNRWQDWFIVLLGIWLFFSPWILNFGWASTAANGSGVGTSLIASAAWNAWVLGVVLFLVGLSTLGSPPMWQRWVSMVLGIWIFIAPWVLGFAWRELPAASWDHWIVGALVFLTAAWGMAVPGPSAPAGRLEGSPR